MSSYYPPRARLSPRALGWWFRLKRDLRLERLLLAGGVSPAQILWSLLIPGYAFIATGRRHLGGAVMGAYVMAGGVFVALLGFALANMIFGLMISMHATSLLWLLRLWVERPPLWLQLGMAGTLLTLLGMTVYWPALRFLEENWLTPLRTPSGVVVVQRIHSPQKVRVGDAIAYRIQASSALNGPLVLEGFGIARVLAKSGDRVEFTASGLLINGERPAASTNGGPRYMPREGALSVPGNHWFVWPNLDIRLYGANAESVVTAGLLRAAVVPQEHYVGKPSRHWFGRRQRVP